MTEIFESNNHLKEAEKHAPEVNYNCRLQDVNSSTTSQNRGDADIGLLMACKVQLSSEVIRWKAESLRLQKERDSAQHRTKELDHTVSKLHERTKDLEMQLAQAEDENKHLKTRSMLDDQRAISIQRLTQSLNRYHSIPTLSNAKESSVSKLLRYYRIPDTVRHQEPLQEDVWERTQKMMEQLHLEMKELQQMNSHINCREDKMLEKEVNSESDCREELEESISSVTSLTESLKHSLLEQRRKLHLIIKNFEELCPKDSMVIGSKQIEPPKINFPKPANMIPAQKAFQDYFAEQLEGLPDLNQIVNQARHMDEDITLHAHNCYESSTLQHEMEEQKSIHVVEERVCPICQMQFRSDIPQMKFEEHVMNHLEAESASLLDQYVVL